MSKHGEPSQLVIATNELLAEDSFTLRSLASRYLYRLADVDMPGVSAAELAEALAFNLEVGAHRVPGAVAVRLHSGGGNRFISLITDDMPYIVDSVTLVLAQHGISADGILHPQLVVQRDATGSIIEVLPLDVDEERPPHALAESWMLVHLAQPLLGAGTELLHAVQRSISDLHAAFDDAQEIRKHAQSLVDEILASRPAPDAEAAEAAALLAWLLGDNFTFLGYREYGVTPQREAQPIAATGLGILRTADIDVSAPAVGRSGPGEQRLLIVNKSTTRSTVVRSAYLDHVGLKRFDSSGNVVGEHRFLGLFTPEAYVASVADIPLIRRRIAFVMQALDVIPGSYDARDLLRFLETYPRDELFQTHGRQLLDVVSAADSLRALRQTRLFVRHDDYGRYVSCLVYLPRDRYNTVVRERMDAILRSAFHGASTEYSALVTESALARIHYVVQVAGDANAAAVDVREVERRIVAATLTWRERFAAGVVARVGEDRAQAVVDVYADAFPEAYKEDFSAEDAVVDALELSALEEDSLGLHWSAEEQAGHVSFTVNRIGDELPLSKVLPLLQHMGLDVIAERPYGIQREGLSPAWVLDFDVVVPSVVAPESLGERACEAFRAAWNGHCEDDSFNALVISAGLTWQQAAILRAYSHYLKQVGSSFGQDYIQSVLLANVPIVRSLVELVGARLDPDFIGDRATAESQLVAVVTGQLDAVASLDHDRILRSFLAVIRATLRTNAFMPIGRARQALSFKLDARSIPDLPLPRPKFEVWVCSPRVEGVHLRFGDVARGGLRWSDRREDFRTEILGLVKAQEVKNAVIVPVGAKGGFVPANLPDPGIDRLAWLAEGQQSYREYLSAILDITDNLVEGKAVPPAGIVRHDGDDPYLVVAADKGTATFSDLANAIAHDYGFWLDDAFASGGSVGYDHKAMGITARGAWEAVKRHFRELGVDTQSHSFSAVGIGDMSGDVFGNGMLLSPHMHLIAAFDHRSIFVDPNPDADAGLAERRRLFELPRSTWADYDVTALSAGGGVFSRNAKMVTLAAEARAALGIESEAESFTPAEVISAILKAPVDLLWNGGIGTYVKARTQTHAEVGDKANDSIRINGDELRCRVVGEGGNLGFTQSGRIEASRSGVRLNTDAIDNSAGVDTSDHEVNIKILLQPLAASGALTGETRVALLASMTDEVAEQVIADNYTQNVALGVGRSSARNLVGVHRRMIAELEASGLLDRALEFLPTDVELASREAAHEGLTSPELCVLLAYAKIALVHGLAEGSLASDPWFAIMLRRYFPQALVERFEAELDMHPLRSQIIDTVTCNGIVGLGGISFVFRAMEETGASAVDVVKAATVIIETFGLREMWERINGLDNTVAALDQDRLQLEFRRLLDRGTRWMLQSSSGSIDVSASIARLRPFIAQWLPRIPEVLQGVQASSWGDIRGGFVEAGIPEDLAGDVVSLLDGFPLLDLAGIAAATGESPRTLVPLYYAVSERYQIDAMLTRISSLRRMDRWDTLARLALRSDLYAVAARLVEQVARSTDALSPLDERIGDWEKRSRAGIARAEVTLAEIDALESPSFASMSVLLRVMRNLAAG